MQQIDIADSTFTHWAESMEEPECETLYHFTYSKHVESIMALGLLPVTGDHCKLLRDRSCMVFCCRKKDIYFWENVFPECDMLLQLKFDNLAGFKCRRYKHVPSGMEYGTDKVITPEHITALVTKTLPEDHSSSFKRYAAYRESLLKWLNRS